MHALGVKRQGARDRLGTGLELGDRLQRRRVGLEAQRGSAGLEPDVDRSEERGGPRPRGAVPLPLLGAQLGAERDELGEVGDDRRPRPARRRGRGRARRGSRRAGSPCRVRRARTAAAGRSAGGTPRRSISSPSAYRAGASAEKTGVSSRSPAGRSAAAQSALSRSASPAIASQTASSAAEELTRGLHGARRSPPRRAPWRRTAPRTATARRRRRARAGGGRTPRSARVSLSDASAKFRTGPVAGRRASPSRRRAARTPARRGRLGEPRSSRAPVASSRS